MTYQNIQYETAEGIAWITLNRQERLNSLSPEMMDEWIDAIETAGRDEAVRVVVVTGAGRAFCTGLDLKSLGETKIENGEVGGERDAAGTGVTAAIQNCPKPVIAMVNGYVFTGALEILFGFDIVIASEEAKFADTHAKWGLRPTWGLTQRMPRILGVNKAKELSFTCRMFSAEEAREYGLVNHVVPADRLREETIALSNQIIPNSAEAIAAIKDLYNKGMQMTLQDGLNYERDTHYLISDTKARLFGFNK
ncbi:MAG: enoyl-CoA hydratase/isomerase family protein [Firmicutes bacterium]|nr:enoyl-CoA hydratase/isomerase family protein [Bacillota bacterium]